MRETVLDYMQNPRIEHPVWGIASYLHDVLRYPEYRLGMTEEQAADRVVEIIQNDLCVDAVLQPLQEGDYVVTKRGLLGQILKVYPSKYITIKILGSGKETRLHSRTLVKVGADCITRNNT